MNKIIGILLLFFFYFNKIINGKSVDIDRRIVNGTNAHIREFPFMISLKGPTEYHICGGSIISNEWILTAAHCINLTENTINSYTVQYSVTNITRLGDTVAKVIDIIVHENFHNLTLQNDIALLKLESPIEFNEYARPIQLPKQNQYIPDGENVTVLGWGMNAVS